MNRRSLLLLAIAAGTLATSLWVGRGVERDWSSAPPALQSILWPTARPVADFELSTQHDRAFSKIDLRGHWSLLYFGYLQCPDVCPTTLQTLRGVQKLLQADGDDPTRFVFVSVDPDNDTPARIGAYLSFFGDDLTGLSGNPQGLATLAGSLGVMYAEHVDTDGTRSMDHTTSIIVVDAQGRGVAALPGGQTPQAMVEQLRAVRGFVGEP
ncbi:MAG: SCO family protein [Rhodanobacteraceae bacterium]|nr:SCO family protein [Rhodanobacteraceae bacterium]